MKGILQLLLWLALTPTLIAAGPSTQVPVSFTSKGAFMAFFVPDVESSVTWYTEKLGLKVVERPPASEMAKVAILEGNGLVVELIQHKDATPRSKDRDALMQGIFKAGVLITDFDSVVATLKERKVEIAIGPFPARGKQRANVIIRDNNGNLIQFFGE